MELCSESERAEYIAKREATIKFFREMEENIRRKFAAAASGEESSGSSNPGSGACSPVKPGSRLSGVGSATGGSVSFADMPPAPARGMNRRIRTISSIDGEC